MTRSRWFSACAVLVIVAVARPTAQSAATVSVTAVVFAPNGIDGGLTRSQRIESSASMTVTVDASATGCRRPGVPAWVVTVRNNTSSGTASQLSVSWRRSAANSTAIATERTTQLSLEPGRSALVDFAEAAGCPALGFGLRIGVPPVEATDAVEGEFMLVRVAPSGAETMLSTQTLRVRAGGGADLVFDAIPGPGGTRTEVAGHFSAFTGPRPGHIGELMIRRADVGASADPPGRAGSATFNVETGWGYSGQYPVPHWPGETDEMWVKFRLRHIE